MNNRHLQAHTTRAFDVAATITPNTSNTTGSAKAAIINFASASAMCGTATVTADHLAQARAECLLFTFMTVPTVAIRSWIVISDPQTELINYLTALSLGQCSQDPSTGFEHCSTRRLPGRVALG
jgi:hypothetical protein